VNRWRQRLAELRGESHERSPALSTVQIVQNVQNPLRVPAFEHSEQIERGTKPAPPWALATRCAIAPCGDREDERAETVEHDNEVPRAWTAGYTRLDPDRSPVDMPSKRWRQFIEDIGLFLDGSFCVAAATLGWGPYDLFGCDRDRPFARIDYAGLLWLINGDKLVALSENTAGIETHTGERHTYRRRPSEPGCVLPWELIP